MAHYSSKPVTVSRPAGQMFEAISNIGAYQQRLDELPAEERARLGEVRFTDDSIIITAQPVGEMRFDVVERVAPQRVVLQAAQSPVPLTLAVCLKPVGEEATEVTSEIDVEIPAMLKPLVGGKMQEAADKFGDLITTFFGGK